MRERLLDVGLLEADPGPEVRGVAGGEGPVRNRSWGGPATSDPAPGASWAGPPPAALVLRGLIARNGQGAGAGPSEPRVAVGRTGPGDAALRGCCGRGRSSNPALRG